LAFEPQGAAAIRPLATLRVAPSLVVRQVRA
jgi:hypothetical protein